MLTDAHLKEDTVCKMNADMNNVEWSNDLFTPSGVVNEYKDNLPVLATIEQGYRGKKENEGLYRGDYVCFSGIGIQKRAVGRDLYKRTFTIPEDYPLKFEIKQATGKFTKAMSMSKILDITTLPVVVRFEKHVLKNFYMDQQMSDITAKNIGEFEIYLVYNEKYLQGAWLGSQYENNYIVLPCDVNVTMRLGMGLTGQSRRAWNTFRDDIGLHGDSLKQPYLQLGYDIVVINKESKDEEDVYNNVCTSAYGLLRHTEVDKVSANSGRKSRYSHPDSGFQEDFGISSHMNSMQVGAAKKEHLSSDEDSEDYVGVWRCSSQPDEGNSLSPRTSNSDEQFQNDVYKAIKSVEIASHVYENDHFKKRNKDYVNVMPDGKPMLPPPRKPGPPPLPQRKRIQSDSSAAMSARNPSTAFQRSRSEEVPQTGRAPAQQPQQPQHTQFSQQQNTSSESFVTVDQVPQERAPSLAGHHLHPASGYHYKRKTSLPVLDVTSVPQNRGRKMSLQPNTGLPYSPFLESAAQFDQASYNRQMYQDSPASYAENPQAFWTSMNMPRASSSTLNTVVGYKPTKKELKKDKKNKKK